MVDIKEIKVGKTIKVKWDNYLPTEVTPHWEETLVVSKVDTYEDGTFCITGVDGIGGKHTVSSNLEDEDLSVYYHQSDEFNNLGFEISDDARII